MNILNKIFGDNYRTTVWGILSLTLFYICNTEVLYVFVSAENLPKLKAVLEVLAYVSAGLGVSEIRDKKNLTPSPETVELIKDKVEQAKDVAADVAATVVSQKVASVVSNLLETKVEEKVEQKVEQKVSELKEASNTPIPVEVVGSEKLISTVLANTAAILGTQPTDNVNAVTEKLK